MNPFSHGGRLLCVIASSVLLAACASTPPVTTITQVEQQLAVQYPQAQVADNTLGQANIDVSSDERLSLDKTVQIMLSHSPQVRIQLARLGIADAKRLQAELIDNPHLSIGLLKPEDGGRWQLDAGLSQPLLDFFTRPLKRKLAEQNRLEAQLILQVELQQLISETAQLYFDAVAELQHCYIDNKLVEAATAKQQLAQSLYTAGNLSENDFLAYDNDLRRAQQQLEKRQSIAYEKQLQLLNFIGLESHKAINLPAQLSPLPSDRFEHSALLEIALHERTDLKIANQQLSVIEQRRTLVGQERGWRDINLGVAVEREFDGAKHYGPEIELALPLFNRGQDKQAMLDAQQDALHARIRKISLDADSAIAQALNRMDSARAQLKLVSAALTSAEKQVELSQREVNFMLSSPFELLSIKRQHIQFAHQFTELLNSYWQARSQLELAVGKALPVHSAGASS